MSVLVKVPAASASSSKMAKKGWKCWAKWITSVNTPAHDGYAYQGEFATVGSDVEVEPGDVLLHVDQSSSAGVGVVVVNSKGEGFVNWMASADSDGRAWCGPLAKMARKLCEMTPAERIKLAAADLVANRPDSRSDAVHAYYVDMAGLPEPIKVDRNALVAEREKLLARIAEINAILDIQS